MQYIRRPVKLSYILLSITCIALTVVSFAHAGDPWVETQKLRSNTQHKGDNFGVSVAVSGNRAVVGAHFDDDRGRGSGSAFVFNASTGKQLLKLLGVDENEQDFFGTSVSLSGDFAVIGSPEGSGNGSKTGSAYVFDIYTGSQLYKFFSPNGQPNQHFGTSVAISGNHVLVGEPDGKGFDNFSTGAAYVFDIVTGKQVLKFFPADESPASDFGNSVALSGNIAVIGTPSDDDNGFLSGSAYVFDISTGEQLYKLLPSDGAPNDRFGYSVATNGTLAVIGSPLHEIPDGEQFGAAYIFDLTTGQQLYRLLASDGIKYDEFGISVAISKNTILVGSYYGSGAMSSSGSAYEFDATTGQQLNKLFASDGKAYDLFGNSIALDGNIAVVGAKHTNNIGTHSGSAYVFVHPTPNLLTVFPEPLHSGQDGIFYMIQMLPQHQTWLLYSLKGLGQTFIPQLNVTIDLLKPKIAAGPKGTDMNGNRQLALPIPDVAHRIDIWFQAVQEQNMTNFVETHIVP